MQVILLQDVPKIGRKYAVLNVADGYANNYLFPNRLAEQATAAKVLEIEKRKLATRAAEDARNEDVKEKLSGLKDIAVMLTAKADDQGHLYKKIHADDIVAALADDHDLVLPETAIVLEHPLHELGDHSVEVHVAGHTTKITVQIVAE